MGVCFYDVLNRKVVERLVIPRVSLFERHEYVIHLNTATSSTPPVMRSSRWKACEQRTALPDPCFSLVPVVLTTRTRQVWGVTEEYFKQHVFPDASDSVLSTLGSASGMVSHVSLQLHFARDVHFTLVYDTTQRDPWKTCGPLVSLSPIAVNRALLMMISL